MAQILTYVRIRPGLTVSERAQNCRENIALSGTGGFGDQNMLAVLLRHVLGEKGPITISWLLIGGNWFFLFRVVILLLCNGQREKIIIA